MDDDLRREVERLRDWRHKEVVPALASARGRLKLLEVDVAEMKPKLDRMAQADEVAEAVRKLIWKAATVVGGVLVGVAAISAALATYLH